MTRYDLEAEDAVRWVKAAWLVGTLGAALLYAAASVPGDKAGDLSSAQSVTHLVLWLLAACGLMGQAGCTAWALRKARCGRGWGGGGAVSRGAGVGGCLFVRGGKVGGAGGGSLCVRSTVVGGVVAARDLWVR